GRSGPPRAVGAVSVGRRWRGAAIWRDGEEDDRGGVLMHLPVLRQGKPYQSLDTTEIKSVRTGEPVATVSQANAGLIRRDLRRIDAAREALRAVPAEELLAICARTGERFME